MLYLTFKLATKKLEQEKNAILGDVQELFDILNNIWKPLFLQLNIYFVSRQVIPFGYKHQWQLSTMTDSVVQTIEN